MRFAAVPLQLQLEFAGRLRWLIRQGNQLLTLGHQQAKGQGRHKPHHCSLLCYRTLITETPELFPAGFTIRKSPSPSCSVRSFSNALARRTSVLVRGVLSVPLWPLLPELVYVFRYTSYGIPKRIPIITGFSRMFSDNDRHKKARRACAVRALRTSSDDSGNHRWRILVELAESDTKY